MFCKDYNSFFRDLLKEDESVYIHYRNVQILAIILFKGKENLSNTIMSDFFFSVNATKFGSKTLR